jgi:hypothetical protein
MGTPGPCAWAFFFTSLFLSTPTKKQNSLDPWAVTHEVGFIFDSAKRLSMKGLTYSKNFA